MAQIAQLPRVAAVQAHVIATVQVDVNASGSPFVAASANVFARQSSAMNVVAINLPAQQLNASIAVTAAAM